MEEVLTDEAGRAERAHRAEARLPDVRPRPAEQMVRETEGELHRAIGQLLVRSVAIVARVVQLASVAAQLFS